MKLQKATDFAAIGLSVLCIVHCLVLPLTLVLFPAFTLAAMTSESFHLWILLGILPLSVIALSVGYKHHRDIKVLQISLPGLLLVMSAPLFENVTLGEYLEVILTVSGASALALGHLRNFRLRKLPANPKSVPNI